jgi:subtilisin family serine protease
MLLIVAVVLPAAGTINEKVTRENKVFDSQTSMEFSPHEFIVKVKQNKAFLSPSLTALNEKHQVYAVEKVFNNAEGTILDNIYLLHVSIGSDILSIVKEYASCPDVVYAEPNGIACFCGIPNDTNFSHQWYLHNTGQVIWNNISGTPDADIDAPEAWDIETGSPGVIVSIVDTGIDDTHPDLATKIWNNTDEIPGNGIDDDHNGYIDDGMGWDFVSNDNAPKDGFGHGTMCSGIAGAVTNNGIGLAGVCCKCTILPIKVLDDTGSGPWVNISRGIKYATDNGADVISMSLGGYDPSDVLRDAVNYAYGKGVFVCAAAGNYNDYVEFYPAAYDNVTAVAATDHNDCRVTPENWGWGSNYGDWVDITAPGNLIYSTMPTYYVYMNGNGYDYSQNYSFGGGTSFATPQVAGVAALLLSKDPSLTPDEVKELICGGTDPYSSTEYIGTGRLNAQKALIALQLSKGIKIKGGLGVKLVITNDGTIDFTNVSWQIHVDGGLYWMINKTKNGIIDISKGKSTTVSTGMLLGLGSISITTWVAGVEKIATGTQLIIFSMVKK